MAQKAADQKAERKRIELVTPDGRTYPTSDPVEAEHLVRTRGYRYVDEASRVSSNDGNPTTTTTSTTK